MIGYVTVGSNDLPRSAKFYDAIAAEMGVGRMMGSTPPISAIPMATN